MVNILQICSNYNSDSSGRRLIVLYLPCNQGMVTENTTSQAQFLGDKTHAHTHRHTRAHACMIYFMQLCIYYNIMLCVVQPPGAEIDRPFGPEHSAQSVAQPLPRKSFRRWPANVCVAHYCCAVSVLRSSSRVDDA